MQFFSDGSTNIFWIWFSYLETDKKELSSFILVRETFECFKRNLSEVYSKNEVKQMTWNKKKQLYFFNFSFLGMMFWVLPRHLFTIL